MNKPKHQSSSSELILSFDIIISQGFGIGAGGANPGTLPELCTIINSHKFSTNFLF